MSAQTLADVGEFGLISALTDLLPTNDSVVTGPGDDAAVVRTSGGHVVISTDMLVEGRHFRRDWASAGEIGHRAAAQNLSDINAMGGRGHTLTLGLAAPPSLELAWVLDFVRGFVEECDLVGAVVVGGDTTRSDGLVIAVTVLGTVTNAPVLRSGAQPGDVLAICGRQGWAAGGLAVLSRGFRSPRSLVAAYARPEPPYDAGPDAAAAGATSMIDVSDGLLADAGHIARASGVHLDISTASLTIPEPLRAVAAATATDPIALVLTGGDDHALLATFPATAVLPAGWTAIGLATQGERVSVDGAEWTGPTGWVHF